MPQVVVSLKGREVSRHELTAVTRIGRDPGMDVVIENLGVSRHHATLRFDGQRYVVVDEDSQNGVFVNGRKTLQQQLSEGDIIQLGKFTLELNDAVSPDGRALAPPPSVSGGAPVPSRSEQKTFALSPADAQALVASTKQAQAELDRQRLQRSQIEPEPVGGSNWWLIGGGVASLLTLVIAYFVLVH